MIPTAPDRPDLLILTFVTEGYHEVLENWFSHLDESSKSICQIGVFGQGYYNRLRHEGYPVFYSGDFISSSSLWVTRLTEVLELTRSGKTVILSDLDAIWISNPLEFLASYESDLIFSQGTIWPRDVHAELGFVYCMGFAMFRPSDFTNAVLAESLRNKNSKFDDQASINRAILGTLKTKAKAGAPDYHLAFNQALKIACFEKTATVEGFLQGIRGEISLLPHSKFRRLQNSLEKETPLVFHPLQGSKGKQSVILSLQANNLWGG